MPANNGVISLLVLNLLMAWTPLVAQERLKGDLDGSGTVDLADFLLFASNFGKTGGATFDPESVDTVLVRDTTTVYRETPKLLPSITVEPGGWQQPVGLVQAVCESVQVILSEPLIFALDSDIVVEHVEGVGSFVSPNRTSNGSYTVWLDTENFHFEQNVFQFAHVYGHVMSNYYQTISRQNNWFGESLSSMASLYVLRKMPKKVQHLTTTHFIPRAGAYAEENIPGQRMEQTEFERWFRARLDELESNLGKHDDRGYNDLIAHNLIDIFETNPEAWNAVRFLNTRGPLPYWNDDQNFKSYLRAWFLRTPAVWQKLRCGDCRAFRVLPRLESLLRILLTRVELGRLDIEDPETAPGRESLPEVHRGK